MAPSSPRAVLEPDAAAPPPFAARTLSRRRALKIAGGVLGTLAVGAGGAAYWALDRYVIDHVEIADVAAYEAAVLASREAASGTSASTATSADDDVTAATAAVAGEPQLTITTHVVGDGDDRVTYFVADVVVSDVTRLRAAFADNRFGTNIVADTSEIAAANGATFAVNGDYYGFRDSGIVVRNGVAYRDEGARTGLAIFLDGTMAVYDETTVTADELVDRGAWQTLSFGPALVDGGEIVDGIEDVEVDTNIGNHSIQGQQPRTGIGMIEAGHFVFVVVDGRSPGYSRGVTMTEFAAIFRELGATVAYNLDGGGSSTMYADGGLVNDPLGKGDERGTSDILYVS